jgi:hypothetical protein
MADVTITLQAASDAVMTTDNLGSTDGSKNLAEGDARRVYGLPNMYIQKGTYSGADDGSKDILKWVTSPRWDTILSPGTDLSNRIAFEATPYFDSESRLKTKSPPTTTAFQLRADTIAHEFTDAVLVSPMPAADIRNDLENMGRAGTPGQLNNIVLALGNRLETIKLSGVLVDRGLVTAANPRRQILLNIARMQHFKTARTGVQAWGGKLASALNPRSYPCLTIFDGLISPGFSVPLEPSGDARIYRGIIKDLSFRLEGGRPDMWFWDMTFSVINNEHQANPLASVMWQGDINRIRLVEGDGGDPDDGSGDTSNGDEMFNFVEIRSSRDLELQDQFNDPILDEATKEPIEFQEGDSVFISGTNSNPTVNGEWIIQGIHKGNRTFILKSPSHWDIPSEAGAVGDTYYGEKGLFDAGPVTIGGNSVGRFTGTKYSQFAWRMRYPTGTSGGTLLFTDGSDGLITWAPSS